MGPGAGLVNSNNKALITTDIFMLPIEEILLKLLGLQYYVKVSICLGFHAANAHLLK